jgi:hypothetical protein
MTITQIFILLAFFQFKHFAADYILQGWPWANYMLGKFTRKGWVGPLSAHCAVHMAFTAFAIVFIVHKPELTWLALVDGSIHFVMDRVKAHPDLMGRWKPFSGAVEYHKAYQEASFGWARGIEMMWQNQLFWWSLGFDQMVHHLTDLFVVWMLV